jgi:hypothetical protein
VSTVFLFIHFPLKGWLAGRAMRTFPAAKSNSGFS